MKKECISMLLAGGQGSRLYALTEHNAKPALPFGGKYRIIDFALSNCANSGIDTVGVLTQYRPLKLNSYLGNGQPWDLDRSDGGVHVLPPYVTSGDSGTWYKGTANAIYQNIGFIDLYDPQYVLILSGDHIYKMDYAKMLEYHKETGADVTISVLEVSMDEASRFGIMNVDDHDQICEFEEKPAHPKSNLASMGVYLFTWEKLRQYLIQDEADPTSSNDFGKNIIPTMLAAGREIIRLPIPGLLEGCGYHRPPCGTPTWISSPPPAASISTTPAGPSTPTVPSCPPSSSVRTRCSPTVWSPMGVRYTAPLKTPSCSTRSRWSQVPSCATPSSCQVPR